jgi:uncharacterized protein
MKKYIFFFGILFLSSCGKNYSPEEKAYIASVEKERKEKDEWMKNDPSSPFNQDSSIHFAPLKYYDVNPDFKFQSGLHEYEKKDSIIILGTKGEERDVEKYGYVLWTHDGREDTINVYHAINKRGVEYYSIWFTDKTTGKETYGVGRYLDFELNPSKEFLYTIDFNEAYSPYCSYSAKYSCAVPSKDDYIDFAIEAGEKKFH